MADRHRGPGRRRTAGGHRGQGPGRRHVVDAGPSLDRRPPGRPSPARPADRRAGRRRARSGHGRRRRIRPGPRSGRRSCSSAAEAQVARAGPGARPGRLVGGRRRDPRDDRGGAGDDDLGRRGGRPDALASAPGQGRTELGGGRHPLAGAGAGDRQRGRDDRPASGLGQVEPGGEPGRQRPVERVAGADRVDRLDPRRMESPRPATDQQQRPLRAEADEGGAATRVRAEQATALAVAPPSGPASIASSTSLGVRTSASCEGRTGRCRRPGPG